MKWKELHVYDLDGTLYRSPLPPTPDPVWFYHAHSFGEPGGPGFDRRWYLGTITHARRSLLQPDTLTIVLTGRPEQPAMRKKIEAMLKLTGLNFHDIVLQPILFPGTIAEYKAAEVARRLIEHPTIQKVVMYDDQVENHDVVGKAVRGRRLEYKGYRTDGL